MVRITRVYTRKGDDGSTSILGAARLPKNSNLIEALGMLDELNSFIGWTIIEFKEQEFSDIKKKLNQIQNELFDLGAFLCNPNNKITFSDAVSTFEKEMDEMNLQLEPLNSFILPGGCELCARLHITRTICRRAECTIAALTDEQKKIAIPYLNRLSDWLFVVARYILNQLEIKELLWER